MSQAQDDATVTAQQWLPGCQGNTETLPAIPHVEYIVVSHERLVLGIS